MTAQLKQNSSATIGKDLNSNSTQKTHFSSMLLLLNQTICLGLQLFLCGMLTCSKALQICLFLLLK